MRRSPAAAAASDEALDAADGVEPRADEAAEPADDALVDEMANSG
ncbi:MAG: hypothetical protein V3S71_08375 [Acidobacteriota bacterium]